jgi:hypothetical protein
LAYCGNLGGVHFTTEPTDGVITTANKTPVDTFYNQIFCRSAICCFKFTATTPLQYGRVWQPVAKAFLARMYLTRGKNAEAIAMANDVIKNMGSLFCQNTETCGIWPT